MHIQIHLHFFKAIKHQVEGRQSEISHSKIIKVHNTKLIEPLYYSTYSPSLTLILLTLLGSAPSPVHMRLWWCDWYSVISFCMGLGLTGKRKKR